MRLVQDNGIGVGLSCSKIICDQLLGSIIYDKEYTDGTCMIVSLPVIFQKIDENAEDN